MLFLDDPFMKNEKYAAGSLDSIADGVLLNQRQVAQILGITPPTAKKILNANNLKTIRFTTGRTSPIFVAAGDLKRFLENGASAEPPTAEPQSVKTQDAPLAVELPPSPVVLQAVENKPQSTPKKPKYLPPAERPKRVEIDLNKYVDSPLGVLDVTPNRKRKTPDSALEDAGLTRWRGKNGVKGYGAKG